MLSLLKRKLVERSSIDGLVFIAAGVAFMVLKPIGTLIALASICYGLYTIYRKD